MNSRTKTKIEPGLIPEIVKACFGENLKVTNIRELIDGWFNSAYGIEFGNRRPPVILGNWNIFTASDPLLDLE